MQFCSWRDSLAIMFDRGFHILYLTSLGQGKEIDLLDRQKRHPSILLPLAFKLSPGAPSSTTAGHLS